MSALIKPRNQKTKPIAKDLVLRFAEVIVAEEGIEPPSGAYEAPEITISPLRDNMKALYLKIRKLSIKILAF